MGEYRSPAELRPDYEVGIGRLRTENRAEHCTYWFYEPHSREATTIVLVVASASGQLWSDERLRDDDSSLPPLWVWRILPFTLALDTALSPIELVWWFRAFSDAFH